MNNEWHYRIDRINGRIYFSADWPAVTLYLNLWSGPWWEWFSSNCKSTNTNPFHDSTNFLTETMCVCKKEYSPFDRLSRRNLHVSCAFLNPSAVQYFSVFLGGIQETMHNVDLYVTDLLQQHNKWTDVTKSVPPSCVLKIERMGNVHGKGFIGFVALSYWAINIMCLN